MTAILEKIYIIVRCLILCPNTENNLNKSTQMLCLQYINLYTGKGSTHKSGGVRYVYVPTNMSHLLDE